MQFYSRSIQILFQHESVVAVGVVPWPRTNHVVSVTFVECQSNGIINRGFQSDSTATCGAHPLLCASEEQRTHTRAPGLRSYVDGDDVSGNTAMRHDETLQLFFLVYGNQGERSSMSHKRAKFLP